MNKYSPKYRSLLQTIASKIFKTLKPDRLQITKKHLEESPSKCTFRRIRFHGSRRTLETLAISASKILERTSKLILVDLYLVESVLFILHMTVL